MVRIVDAWVGPGAQISVVYFPPWSDRAVGLRREQSSGDLTTYPDFDGKIPMDAELFGASVADWDIGEPLGLNPQSMWRDSSGLLWWGDLVGGDL